MAGQPEDACYLSCRASHSNSALVTCILFYIMKLLTVMTCVDVSDSSMLQITNQQLARTNADLDNFVYAASHDLKQPVNNLRGL
ncbi:MAG: hypothetical protein EOP55_24155, partial [Sphingobacteriales bacterium]